MTPWLGMLCINQQFLLHGFLLSRPAQASPCLGFGFAGPATHHVDLVLTDISYKTHSDPATPTSISEMAELPSFIRV